MPLALFSPLPRPVTLAGRVYRARPLRLRDLFALADLAAGEPPGVPEGDPDDEAYQRALREAFDAADAWPGRWTDALGTDEGCLYVLSACLRDERLASADVVELAGELTNLEWRRLMALAFAADPAASVAAAIDGAIGVDDRSEGASFPEAIARFWSDHGGLTEDALLDVSLSMFKLARTGGERNIVDPDSSSEAQGKRARFWSNGSVVRSPPLPEASGQEEWEPGQE